jgi:predicted amidohydrolase
VTPFKAGLIQMRSGQAVADKAAAAEALIREAAAAGARYIQTPEMTNILVKERDALFAAISDEAGDPTLAAMCRIADELDIFLHLGSLAIRRDVGTVANRSFLIGPDGRVVARYDKIHMFDVDLDGGESWRESRTYQPGDRAVVADLLGTRLGLTICYDVRFPQLHRALARAGAQLLASPAAFTRQTGEAHWHVLLRARAIETGSFVLAAAQGGRHADGRETYGHSLVVDPWGRVIAEADNDAPGIVVAEIDPAMSAAARQRIPALANDRPFAPPGAPQSLRSVS